MESTMKKKDPVVPVPEVPQEPARRVTTKVRWLGMAKPDDPIYRTGLVVTSANSKPSTTPSPTSETDTPPSTNEEKKLGSNILLRSRTPEEYKTQGGWQIGTFHRASPQQSEPASSGTKRKTARGKTPSK
jgi:hypothetical protein